MASALELLTTGEIARKAQLSQRAINMEITGQKLIPFARAGIIALFTTEEVSRWLASRGGPGRRSRHGKNQGTTGHQHNAVA